MWPKAKIIVADESFDGRSILMLQNNGYLIFSIAKECPGISDDEVIQIAIREQAFIITEDKDFGDQLVYKAPKLWVPALLIRLHGINIEEKNTRILSALFEFGDKMLSSFSVLSQGKLRMRKFNENETN